MLYRDGYLYLQGHEVFDILFLSQDPPRALTLELIRNRGPNVLLGDVGHPYAFNYRITDEASIKWITKQAWALDYDQFAEKSISELNEMRIEEAKFASHIIKGISKKRLYIINHRVYNEAIMDLMMVVRSLSILIEWKKEGLHEDCQNGKWSESLLPVKAGRQIPDSEHFTELPDQH